MKKVFFSKNSENSYDVLTAGKQNIGKAGELNFNQERKIWVYEFTGVYGDDGVDFYNDLQESMDELKFELENFVEPSDTPGTY